MGRRDDIRPRLGKGLVTFATTGSLALARVGRLELENKAHLLELRNGADNLRDQHSRWRVLKEAIRRSCGNERDVEHLEMG